MGPISMPSSHHRQGRAATPLMAAIRSQQAGHHVTPTTTTACRPALSRQRVALLSGPRLQGTDVRHRSRRRGPAIRAMTAARMTPGTSSAAAAKDVWIQTTTKEVMTTAVESGLTTFLFEGAEGRKLSESWKELARIDPMNIDDAATLRTDSGDLVGTVESIASAEDLKDLQKTASAAKGRVLVQFEGDCWQVIPAENLIAAFHSSAAELMCVSSTASDAKLMLEALELGVTGVVLETDNPQEVRQMAAIMREREFQGSKLTLEAASVTRVQPVGMGDRVCVDTCSLMTPGEGLLVGNFARAMFLVHSECAESSYIASRPFRVNAGPVHAYTQGVEGKTAYLSELTSGSQVTVVNADGMCRTVIVGRLKVETRPLLLVEAETSDGLSHSTILQNAETVRLIGPATTGTTASSSQQAVSVSELKLGDEVYVYRQGAARHTGIEIDEQIVEK